MRTPSGDTLDHAIADCRLGTMDAIDERLSVQETEEQYRRDMEQGSDVIEE